MKLEVVRIRQSMSEFSRLKLPWRTTGRQKRISHPFALTLEESCLFPFGLISFPWIIFQISLLLSLHSLYSYFYSVGLDVAPVKSIVSSWYWELVFDPHLRKTTERKAIFFTAKICSRIFLPFLKPKNITPSNMRLKEAKPLAILLGRWQLSTLNIPPSDTQTLKCVHFRCAY